MLESDDIWKDVRPFMNAKNDKLFVNLRDIYREGIPRRKFSKTQLEGSKNFTPFYQKSVEKIWLEKQLSYHQGLFGEIN